jgi:predicted dehydrogenase
MSAKPIKVGIIGYGYWGPMIVRNFDALPDVELAWVCDADAERRGAMSARYPHIAGLSDSNEALASDVDAVVIATPPTTHFPLASQAIESGKHVLIEKPITTKSEDALALHHAASDTNRVLMVGHIFRYNPAVEVVKGIINSGELGDIYYAACTRTNLGRFSRSVNVLWDLGPHDLSILLYLLGEPPEAVNARGKALIQPDVEDVVFMYLRFPHGPVAHLHLSWLDPLKLRQVLVVGSKKMLVYDDIAADAVVIHDKGVDITPRSETLEEFKLAYRYGEPRPVPIQAVEPLSVECAHFIECVRFGKEPSTGAKDGYEIVRILEAGQRSLESGGSDVLMDWAGSPFK